MGMPGRAGPGRAGPGRAQQQPGTIELGFSWGGDDFRQTNNFTTIKKKTIYHFLGCEAGRLKFDLVALANLTLRIRNMSGIGGG